MIVAEEITEEIVSFISMVLEHVTVLPFIADGQTVCGQYAGGTVRSTNIGNSSVSWNIESESLEHDETIPYTVTSLCNLTHCHGRQRSVGC